MEAASGGTFRMRRNGAGCLRRHTFFWLVRKDNVQPPFPLMSKEKVAGGEKETSKGGFASEQTSHPSSCPPRARPRPIRVSCSKRRTPAPSAPTAAFSAAVPSRRSTPFSPPTVRRPSTGISESRRAQLWKIPDNLEILSVLYLY